MDQITKQEIARLSAQSKIRVSTNKELQKIQDELNKYKKKQRTGNPEGTPRGFRQVEEKRRRGKRG